MTVVRQTSHDSLSASSPPTEATTPATATARTQKRYGRWYAASIAGLAAAALAAGGGLALGAGDGPVLVSVAILLAIPMAVQLAGTLVHLVLRAVLRPSESSLPRLSPLRVKPALAATCVVYPVILYDRADVDALVSTMRDTHRDSGPGFLAHVALVDFADGPSVELATDALLRAYLEHKLSRVPVPPGGPPLVALFRARRWNPADRTWMGWERKRGKLVEFTDLVAGAEETSFQTAGDRDRAIVQMVRRAAFAVTLDVGNRLPAGGARQLVATLAHPANRPVVDERTATVVSGFGYIRPCHSPSPPRTLFEWAWQPYSAPRGQASFGQALFGEDLFLGQGAFDVAAVRAVLRGRIPDNSVLSHDKLEGMHARTACIAEAVVVEGNLDDYLAYRQRSHRWIRGDVHLLPWIVRRGGSGRRSMPLLARWTMFSDVIQHVAPISAIGLLALAWLAVPANQTAVWTTMILALLLQHIVVLPLMVFFGRTARPSRTRWRRRVALHLRPRLSLSFWLLRVELLRAPIWISLLADRAAVAADACVRALYRTVVSHRFVLEWTSSTHASRTIREGSLLRWRRMTLSWAGAAVLASVIGAVRPGALGWAAPLLLMWILAPQVAYWASLPVSRVPFSPRPSGDRR